MTAWRVRWCKATALAILVTLVLSSCGQRTGTADEPASAARAPGTISVPFRNRWWHYYERGLSWADAGDDLQAERDFRQCLALRQSDARLARTYGMHFVQCFAHRELGAVLLRQGRTDEAERELRLSIEQEPSAKAEYLLQRIGEQRGSAPPRVRVPPKSASQRTQVDIERVTTDAVSVGMVHVAGRFMANATTVLWAVNRQGQAQRVVTNPKGEFTIDADADAALALGDAAGPDPQQAVAMPVASPHNIAPTLELQGPDGGIPIADGRAWYRWNAASPAGLAQLIATDSAGTVLARCDLHGQRSAGTMRVDVPAGPQVVQFTIVDTLGKQAVAVRQVESRSSPQQDRGLRAVAMALPLQPTRPGATRPADDPRLLSALVEDGRFRFVDLRADEILTRELTLVEAGYVDRVTAAAAGRRLACRYVIAGTMNRGERDAECFLRLVHCGSGQVMAVADAYSETADDAAVNALVEAVTGRLRQAFPVVAGEITQTDEAIVFTDRAGGIAHGLMRLHVFARMPEAGELTRPAGVIELNKQAPRQGTLIEGVVPAHGWGVSE